MPSGSVALAALLGGKHHGPETQWTGVATIQDATRSDLSFAEGPIPPDCQAGVVLTRTPISGRCCIVVDDPKLSFIQILTKMFHVEHAGAIHPNATVDPSASVHDTAVVHAGAVIMGDCKVGASTTVFPNVVMYPKTVVGNRVRIHAGAVIGADGFGYHPGPAGPMKIPHVGHVVIEDDVEIGANVTIDRGFLAETRIGRGSKLDNLVHVAHNVSMGRHVVIAAQTGISGSVTIGDGVVMGGQVGIVEHTEIGPGARIGAQSGVTRAVASGDSVLGSPAESAMKMKRIYARMRGLHQSTKD